MNQKSFNMYAGVIFLVVAIVHLLRIFNGWGVSIGDFALPMWGSWVAVLITGCLAYHGLKKR